MRKRDYRNHCFDCGKLIGQARRCNASSTKEMWARPGYKEKMKKILFRGGKRKGKCIDCGVDITSRNQRCNKCSGINKRGKSCMTKEGRDKLSKRTGKNNPNWRGGKWKIKNAFENKIRRLQKYRDWKNVILKRDVVSYPRVPKNVQVHHLKSFRSILEENNIQTVGQAKDCTTLWDTDNGVALWKSEHFAITVMCRRKNISPGFISYLEYFILRNEARAKEIK